MSKYVIDGSTLTSIGNAIREKTGGTESIPVTDLATSISAIAAGDYNVKLIQLSPTSTSSLTLTEEMLNAKYLAFGSYNKLFLVNMSDLSFSMLNYTNSSFQTNTSGMNDYYFTIEDGVMRYRFKEDNSATSIFYAQGKNKGWMVIIS